MRKTTIHSLLIGTTLFKIPPTFYVPSKFKMDNIIACQIREKKNEASSSKKLIKAKMTYF